LVARPTGQKTFYTGQFVTLDQASLKLLLRARAELIAAMLLIGSRVRQKHALNLAPVAERIHNAIYVGVDKRSAEPDL
jgi:hypothetical protein